MEIACHAKMTIAGRVHKNIGLNVKVFGSIFGFIFNYFDGAKQISIISYIFKKKR